MGSIMFDIIVPLCNYYKNSFGHRIAAIKYIYQNFFIKQKGLGKIIYVEQALETRTPYLDEIRCFAIQNPGPYKVALVGVKHPVFNKQWCINVGVKNTESPDIVIADCDIWGRDNIFDRTFRLMRLSNSPWAFAWNRMVQTDEKERGDCIIEGCFPIGSRSVVPSRGGFEGGFVAFKRQFFIDIGMANEEMTELGGVDNDIVMRAEYASGQYLKNPAVAVHLWHPRPRIQDRRSRPSRVENIKILLEGKKDIGAYIERLKKKNFGDYKCPA
jgi:hypothetical protein